MIHAQQLSKTFGRVLAVRDVGFYAADGKITGLLGPNGAGKSTTLRLLSTVIKPDQGSARIDDHDLHKDSLKIRHHIGVLPHNAGLYTRLSARENILYYGRLYGLSEMLLKQRIDELIELLDMQDFIDRRAEGFSQGQRTKVGLARALVHKPRNLLLDEPANGLDVMATRGLRNLIKRLRDQGHCILISSHIMQEISLLCDHLVIIAQGRVMMQGTLDEIRAQTGATDLEDAFVTAINPGTEPMHA